MRDMLIDLIGMLLTAAVPVLLAYIHRYLGIAADSRAALVVNRAVDRGAGMLYSAAARGIINLSNNAAVQQMSHTYAGQAIDRVAQSAARLGITRAQVAEMIQAEFGRLLAADPAVQVKS